MKLPALTRKLVLEDAYRVPDDAGGYATEWRPLGTLWAEIKSGSGREQARNELSLSRVSLRITVRAATMSSPARPHAGQRFRDGERVFPISAVTERDAEGRYLICHAQEEVTA